MIVRPEQVATLPRTKAPVDVWSGIFDPTGGLWLVDRIGGGVHDVGALVASFDLARTASFLDRRPGWSGPVFAVTCDLRDRWHTPRPPRPARVKRPRQTTEERRAKQRAYDQARYAARRAARRAAAGAGAA